MYVYRNSGIGALIGIGNYDFHGFGAADEVPVVVPGSSEPVTAAVASEILESVTTPATAAADMAQTAVETPSALTDAQTDQKKFGYFGSMPVSVGTQVMSISGGVAISVIGFLVGMKLANSTRVSTKEIILASVIASASAFVGILAIKTFQ